MFRESDRFRTSWGDENLVPMITTSGHQAWIKAPSNLSEMVKGHFNENATKSFIKRRTKKPVMEETCLSKLSEAALQ